ncbi:hypothetical protein [Desulfotomaculum copahuensis]|uniref:DUF4878 domain-containing protein n=1 Tax=Desulfotomaculum copahuensis TaxID=1838280 RepID=A0A1B7LG51_9FIRM|nr:hypothetical protein [Desulfotomaculum copahuensis]OAT83704.1 hypothetical protein A6M21_07660 [Desulfotomaculum copahuensis]
MKKTTLALMVLVIVLMFCLAACGNSKPAEPVHTPGKDFVAFWNAMVNNNYSEAAQYIEMSQQGQIKMMYGSVAGYLAKQNAGSVNDSNEDNQIRILSEDIKGTNANVIFEIKIKGKWYKASIPMVREDGIWRITLTDNGDLPIEPAK